MAFDRNEALIEISHAIASEKDVSSLFQALVGVLRTVISFDIVYLALFNPDTHEASIVVPQGVHSEFIEGLKTEKVLFEDGPGWDVWSKQVSILCTRLENDSNWSVWSRHAPSVNTGENKARYLKLSAKEHHNIRTWCLVPLTGAHRRLGTLELSSSSPNVYTEQEVHFIEQVALQVAISVENALNYESARESENHLRMLLDVMNATVSKRNLKDLMSQISGVLRQAIGVEYVGLHLYDKVQHSLWLETVDFQAGSGSMGIGKTVAVDNFPWHSVLIDRKFLIADNARLNVLAKNYPSVASMVAEGLRGVCAVPLFVNEDFLGVLTVGYRAKETFSDHELNLLQEIAKQLSVAADNALAYQEISELKDKLASEKSYLEEEIRTVHNFEEIIGESAALKQVLAAVEIVATTDSTVLILGETGTGKELIARAIHNLSARKNRALVKLNCAAFPSGLLESELFGHEKGAYTGAVSQRMGRLELAHQGTLFLDEIGELPLELQPKLLRALQEREFEALGGNRLIQSDFRLIAATNRNLESMTATRQFRSDLYYRLNVFPIIVPPLRERRDDIPILVRHFTQKYARKMNRHIASIPTEAILALTQGNWSGNVRELENVIERAVILSSGPVLKVGLESLKDKDVDVAEPLPKTSMHSGGFAPTDVKEDSESSERERIVMAMVESRGIVSGPNGAASKLGLRPATLLAKMQLLASLEDTDPMPQPSEYAVSPDDLQAVEREHIIHVLREANWVIAGEKGAAARLGMKRTTLITRMARFGISRPQNVKSTG